GLDDRGAGGVHDRHVRFRLPPRRQPLDRSLPSSSRRRRISRMPPMERGSMKMPKPSEAAKVAFSKLVADEPAVTLKPMFGQLSAFVNGNMFCGIFGEELMVRLPEAEIE